MVNILFSFQEQFWIIKIANNGRTSWMSSIIQA